MRKKLLAVIFLPGFAVFATIGSAQVLKGSQPADSKPESTVKSTKGTAATASSSKVKRAPAALDAGSKDPARHTGAATTSKTAAHPEALTVKQKRGIDTRTGGATAKPEMGDESVHFRKTGKSTTRASKSTATDDWEATGSSKAGHKKPANDNWQTTEAVKTSNPGAQKTGKSAAKTDRKSSVKQGNQPK